MMIEKQEGKERLGILDRIKLSLTSLKKNISDTLSKPKEGTEEYNRLTDFLGDKLENGEKVDDYIKYWSIKKIKTAIKLMHEGIIKKENISKKGAYMDERDDKKIGTAKELTKIGMEIHPYDYEYMKYRTEKEIENLKLFKEKNGDSLEYNDIHPFSGNSTILEISAMKYKMFSNGIPTDIIKKEQLENNK